MTAWRRGATVTGIDLVPRMLELANENAALVGASEIEWQQADAADLPFADDSFDVVLSCFGHVAASDPDAAGRELARVTKPGGRIAYTSWTPDGLTRPILGTLLDYLPSTARPDTLPDFLWADSEIARDRLGHEVADVTIRRAVLRYRFLSPQHFWTHVAENAGPFVAMRRQVAGDDRTALDQAIADVLDPHFERNELQFEYAIVSATPQ